MTVVATASHTWQQLVTFGHTLYLRKGDMTGGNSWSHLVIPGSSWSHIVNSTVPEEESHDCGGNSWSHLATAGHAWQQLATPGNSWSHTVPEEGRHDCGGWLERGAGRLGLLERRHPRRPGRRLAQLLEPLALSPSDDGREILAVLGRPDGDQLRLGIGGLDLRLTNTIDDYSEYG